MCDPKLEPRKAQVDGWSCLRFCRKRASQVMAGYLFFLETAHLENPKREESLKQEADGSREQGRELALTQETKQTEGEEVEGSQHQDIFEDEEAMESDPDALNKDSACPKEEDTTHFQGTPGCKSCNYVLVRTPETFDKAQVRDRRHGEKVKGKERDWIKTSVLYSFRPVFLKAAELPGSLLKM